MIFRKDGKPSTSHLFDVRDAITGNGNSATPHGQFREQERRWQVSNMLRNHRVLDGKRNEGFEWVGSSSAAFSKNGPPNLTMSAGSSFGWLGRSNYNNNTRIHSTSSDPVVINDGILHQFEMPFRLEVDSI